MEDPISNTNETPFKKAEFGFGGIILGLVFVVVVLLIFNYLNLINLPFNLPQKTQDKVVTSSTKLLDDSIKTVSNTIPGSQPISVDLQEKAQKAGYSIIWQGDASDVVGRTILASAERENVKWIDNFGWFTVTDQGKTDIWRLMGFFKGFEVIKNSKDFYMILINPLNNDKKKIRIINNDNSETKSSLTTSLYVEDLSKLIRTKDNNFMELFDSIDNLSQEKLSELIRSGDIILAYGMLNSKPENENSEYLVKRDEYNEIIVKDIVIRRFGGIKNL